MGFLLGFVPAPYRLLAKAVGAGLMVLALVAALAAVKHSYDERVRAPLKQELAALTAAIKANKQQAARLLQQREAENQQALNGYIQYARTSDENYAAEISRVRAARNTADGLRLIDPYSRNRCAAAGQTGAGGAGTPETATAAGELSGELAAFLRAEAERADQVSAYAQSCYRFVHGQ